MKEIKKKEVTFGKNKIEILWDENLGTVRFYNEQGTVANPYQSSTPTKKLMKANHF